MSNIPDADEKNLHSTGKSKEEKLKQDNQKNDAGETVEETKTKNEDAAAEVKEGDFGERSYASPDFDNDPNEDA